MATNSWEPNQFSVQVAAHQAYALKILACESAHSLKAIAAMPLDTHIDEAFGVTREARIRIMVQIRLAFGADMPKAATALPATLRELIHDLVPRSGTAECHQN